jgi:Protein of unknown function (DUF3455)
MTLNTLSYADVDAASPFILTLSSSPGSAALRIENSELPAEIQVDETKNQEVARRLGAGIQVYDCDPGAGSFKFREPQANLYDLGTGLQRGIHFVGPQPGTAQWADFDGSRVIAKVVARVDAPPPADAQKDVQWLKAETQETFGKKGIFGAVTAVQRVLTYSGKPPASCNGEATIGQSYATLYIFWAAR